MVQCKYLVVDSAFCVVASEHKGRIVCVEVLGKTWRYLVGIKFPMGYRTF
jgi:hypothetical protein